MQQLFRILLNQHSLFINPCSLFFIPCSIFFIPCSLFFIPCSLIIILHSLFIILHSLFIIHCSSFIVHHSLFPIPCPSFLVPFLRSLENVEYRLAILPLHALPTSCEKFLWRLARFQPKTLHHKNYFLRKNPRFYWL